ncbi:MAG TPA: lysophospholipid acyltransferase family protein [Desulfobacterales bacterium]|jgi:predicted LPLAT superfamily acyltransferase|nr:lysophospholipid acyltransferase family protein [Desulfobacterales bacterium]
MFYRILPFLARIFGVWTFDLIAKGIAAGYFLFAPRRVMVSVRFYRALFPQRARVYPFWCAWKQFQNFTSVYLDRYRFHEVGDISYTNEGWEHVENALDRKTGGIVLMSHLGNWEIAAHLMKQKREQMPLILFMGQRAKAHIERIQKEDLRRRGIRIVAAEKSWETSFDLIEGLRFIQDGGLVSMTGDQIWDSRQRVVPVSMIGHEVYLPETPHVLAMLSGAPLIVFFSRRTGKKRYHLKMAEPLYVEKAPRRLRAEAIRKSAQGYADLLETHLRGNPFEWYHFKQFLGPRQK